MNVLIVEDYKELAKEIIDFLTKSGYLCKWVSNCNDGIHGLQFRDLHSATEVIF